MCYYRFNVPSNCFPLSSRALSVSSRSAAGPGPGVHCQSGGAAAPPGTQPHGHVCHLLRGHVLLPIGPRHPRRHVRPLPAQPPGAGRPAQGPGAAVGGHRGAEPRAAGPAQRDGRDVWLLDGLLAVQPGGDAVDLASGLAGAAGTARLMNYPGLGGAGREGLLLNGLSACAPVWVFAALGMNMIWLERSALCFSCEQQQLIWCFTLKALE